VIKLCGVLDSSSALWLSDVIDQDVQQRTVMMFSCHHHPLEACSLEFAHQTKAVLRKRRVSILPLTARDWR